MNLQINQIPRVFYTSVPSLKRVDARLRDNWNFLVENNPGWSHVAFDDETLLDFISSNYGHREMAAYERINKSYGAARADYFRYLLLYKKGGVWLDAKTCIDKKMEEILKPDDEFLIAQWTIDQTNEANELFWGPRSRIPVSEFLTWCIFSKPKHVFMKSVVESVTQNINSYHPAIHGIGGMGVLGTTGPLAYTRAIYPLLQDSNWRKVVLEEEQIRYTIFTGVFEHRDVIGTNYRRNLRPVINRGYLINSETVIAILILTVKKLIRRLRQLFSKAW